MKAQVTPRMPEQTSAIISKVWGMCNPLRDDGVSYGDYLEQLTYLIFLKMSDEYQTVQRSRKQTRFADAKRVCFYPSPNRIQFSL